MTDDVMTQLNPQANENKSLEMLFFSQDYCEASYLRSPGSPRIVITNSTHIDEWRSSSTEHDIRWERYDFPSLGYVKIEYFLDS